MPFHVSFSFCRVLLLLVDFASEISQSALEF